MKKLLILMLLFTSVALHAQISIDETSLPIAGDTIWQLEDNIPNINLGRTGARQTWDFTSLNSGMSKKHVLTTENENLLSTSLAYDFIEQVDRETLILLKKIDNEIYEVAVQRPHPLNSSISVLSTYASPRLKRYANMKYGDDKTASSLIYYSLADEEIPNLVKKKLPITADSIRIKVEEVQDLRNDAWGSVNLSYNSFDVLRQDQTVHMTVSAEVYSAGKWSLINDNILDPGRKLLGTTTERYYNYYASNVKGPLVSIKVSNTDQPLSAIFEGSYSIGSIVNISDEDEAYILSPNPSFGDVKLEMMNAPFDTYKFEVFNVIGKRLWSDELLVNNKFTSYKFDFSFLGKGTYLWALTDSRGIRASTKRLVIITP